LDFEIGICLEVGILDLGFGVLDFEIGIYFGFGILSFGF